MMHRLLVLLFAIPLVGAFYDVSRISCKWKNKEETEEVQTKRCQDQYLLNANFVSDVMKIMNNYNYTEYSDKTLRDLPIKVTIQPQVGIDSVEFKGFQEFKAWLQNFRDENNVEFFTPSKNRDLQTNDHDSVGSKWTAISKIGKLEGFFFFSNENGKLSELEMQVNKNNYGDAEDVRKNFYKCSWQYERYCREWITNIETLIDNFRHVDQIKEELIEAWSETTFGKSIFNPVNVDGLENFLKSEDVKYFENLVLMKPEINKDDAYRTDISHSWPVFVRIDDKDLFGTLGANFNVYANEHFPRELHLWIHEPSIYDYDW